MRILNYIFMALAAISSLTFIIVSVITDKSFETWAWPLGTFAWITIAFMNIRTIEGYEKLINELTKYLLTKTKTK